MPKTRGAPPRMVAVSLAVALTEPPPETVTWLMTCDGALLATLTVTVIGA